MSFTGIKPARSLAVAGILGLIALVGSATGAAAHYTTTQCDRDGDHCWVIGCDDDGDDCHPISDYYRPLWDHHRPHWVCDWDGDDCHWTRDRYNDDPPRIGFSFGWHD